MTRISEFQKKGYILATGILSEQIVEDLIRDMDVLSRRYRGPGGWTAPDGVTQLRRFWPLIFNETLLNIVREVIGPDFRFLQHNDLHVGFSSLNWHRDSVSRKFGDGPDWDETEPYRIVRVGFYLQPRRASAFRLGLLPGTHRAPLPSEALERERLEGLTGTASLLRRFVFGKNRSHATAEWLKPAAGDAVIFDPRVLHTGSRTGGPKYSIFLAYGSPNSHYMDHAIYYRFLRPELDYRPMHPDLVTQLQAAGLYQEVERSEWKVSGATLPGFIQSIVARRVRHRISEA
jgi:hypothetical protein